MFLDEGTVLYTVDDPTVASVSADGTVKGLKDGVTTLTATLLPYGSSVTITVRVGSNVEDCPKDDTCPLSAFTDLDMNAWYHDGIHWALTEGAMAGTSATTFSPTTTATNGKSQTTLSPKDSATRAQIATVLWRLRTNVIPQTVQVH